jgi:hypothetical protein
MYNIHIATGDTMSHQVELEISAKFASKEEIDEFVNGLGELLAEKSEQTGIPETVSVEVVKQHPVPTPGKPVLYVTTNYYETDDVEEDVYVPYTKCDTVEEAIIDYYKNEEEFDEEDLQKQVINLLEHRGKWYGGAYDPTLGDEVTFNSDVWHRTFDLRKG